MSIGWPLDTSQMQQQEPTARDRAQYGHCQTCRSPREDQLEQRHGVVDALLEGPEGAVPVVCGYEDALTAATRTRIRS